MRENIFYWARSANIKIVWTDWKSNKICDKSKNAENLSVEYVKCEISHTYGCHPWNTRHKFLGSVASLIRISTCFLTEADSFRPTCSPSSFSSTRRRTRSASVFTSCSVPLEKIDKKIESSQKKCKRKRAKNTNHHRCECLHPDA